MRLRPASLLVLSLIASVGACASSRRGGTDAPPVDAGGSELGTSDGAAPDSGGPDGSTADSGADAGADAGHDAGGVDAGHDAGAAMPVTVHFPSTGDTVHTMMMNYWNLGDFVEGSRTTTVPSITHATLDVGVAPNTLTCDTEDMKVVINGTMVGAFMIHMGDTVLTNTYTFPAIAGPTYTLHFETTRTVMGGCGSAGFDMTTSTVTLAP